MYLNIQKNANKKCPAAEQIHNKRDFGSRTFFYVTAYAYFFFRPL